MEKGGRRFLCRLKATVSTPSTNDEAVALTTGYRKYGIGSDGKPPFMLQRVGDEDKPVFIGEAKP